MKNNDYDKQDGTKKCLHQPHQCRKIEDLGEKINNGQDTYAQHHLDRAGPAYDGNQLMDYECDNKYVEEILPAKELQTLIKNRVSDSCNEALLRSRFHHISKALYTMRTD